MTGTAQVTLQVCLERAVFIARFKGSKLDSEYMTYKIDQESPEAIRAAPKRDLVLRAAILRNVVSILRSRLVLLDADILTKERDEVFMKNSDRLDVKRFRVVYKLHSTLEEVETIIHAFSIQDAESETLNVMKVCGLNTDNLIFVSIKEAP